MEIVRSDILVVGAGPAGATLALHMAAKGYDVIVVDKEKFPRAKICGDALGGKAVTVLKRLPGNLFAEFLTLPGLHPSRGIRFTAPAGISADIFFPPGSGPTNEAPGFTLPRHEFDGFLARQLRLHPNIRFYEGEKVRLVGTGPGYACAFTDQREYRAHMLTGADGSRSVTRRALPGLPSGEDHSCLGFRAYYRNVGWPAPDHLIELYFQKRLLPGYFWIFPIAGGLFNVGLGMPMRILRRRKINTMNLFRSLITEDPYLAPMFREAIPAGQPGAGLLPLGSQGDRCSGNRILLLGDAASLVDPFTGEGIGNAMASGETAAEIAAKAMMAGDFSAGFLSAYDKRIIQRMGGDFRTLSAIQRLAGNGPLFNFVVRKARANEEVRNLLQSMYTNGSIMKKLTRPAFYLSLLTR